MKHGDLSNRVSPKILIVWEGVIGILTDQKKFHKAIEKDRWDDALRCFALNEMVLRRILWLYHKRDVNIEVVTFVSEGLADEVRACLDDEQVPIQRVWYTTPHILARKIAYMPDLACVYDPDPARWLTYGPKGRYITSEAQIGDY